MLIRYNIFGGFLELKLLKDETKPLPSLRQIIRASETTYKRNTLIKRLEFIKGTRLDIKTLDNFYYLVYMRTGEIPKPYVRIRKGPKLPGLEGKTK